MLDTVEDPARFVFTGIARPKRGNRREFLYIDDIGLGKRPVADLRRIRSFTGPVQALSWGIYAARMFSASWKMPACAGWNQHGKAVSQ